MPSRDMFTPPDEWQMTIAEKRPMEAPKENLPAFHGQADTTANKRTSGRLVTLPTKTATESASSATPSSDSAPAPAPSK
jgi:hypothetical protein